MAKGPAYAQTQAQKEEDPMLKILITSLSVTDRPDLCLVNRKHSTRSTTGDKGGLSQLKMMADLEIMEGKKGKNAFGTAGDAALHYLEGENTKTHGSVSSMIADDDDDDVRIDPTQVALPTMMMAGTVWGEVLRADLSKNKVDVETNNLRKLYLSIYIMDILQVHILILL